MPGEVTRKEAARLQERLGHHFTDAGLLERALTHRSAAPAHNERLEFLGDAVIELVVTEWLYRSMPMRSEGELTRLRAGLVRRESLAELARELSLGPALRLGSGELKSGGRHRDSILADGFEALIGALYLDAGLTTCRDILLSLVEPRIGEPRAARARKDPKTRLQEWLQGRGMALPAYTVVEVRGEEHEREFRVECALCDLERAATASGSSRRRAEQAAAALILERLEDDG